MKKIYILLGAVAAMAAASCNRELIPDGEDEIHAVTLSLSVQSPIAVSTKADSYSASEEDNFIDRLDMLEYDKNGTLTNHRTWTRAAGLDLSTVSYTAYGAKYDYKYWLFLANFDEESIDYLTQLSGSELGNNPAKGIVPLEAGNYRLHKPLMGGSATSSFSSDKTLPVTLFRYLTKFEIGTVTAGFIDEGYLESDVKLKKIAITHTPNFLRPLYRSVTDIYGGQQDVHAVGYSYPNGGTGSSIGNLEHYSTCVNRDVKNSNATGTFNLTSYGATGALAADFPYAYNYNKGLDKGVLVTDAPGDMYTATVHEFGANEGILCKSDDEDWPHTYNINKVLYTIPWYRNQYGYLWGEFNSQDDTQKMVFQVEIDGSDYFYIIPMRELEAGMIYRLGNITLKGLGSEYSNFYVRKYEAGLTPFSIDGWNDCDINNIDMGYKDYAGTEIF